MTSSYSSSLSTQYLSTQRSSSTEVHFCHRQSHVAALELNAGVV